MKYLILVTILLSAKFVLANSFQCHNLFAEAVEPLNPRTGEINYKVFGGEHSETIVMIPGLDSAMQTFFNVTRPLAQKYRVVVLDQRGHGQSVEKGDNYSSEVLARDVKVLLDHLSVQKAHVLGHSMGARTAARLALMYPDVVKSLIIEDMELISRGSGSLEKYSDEIAQMRALPKKFASRAELIASLTPLFGDEAESLSYRRARENTDGSIELLFRPHVSVIYGVQGNVENLLTPARDIKAPILVMVANPKKGTAVSANGLRAFERLPQAKIQKFENAGHVIHRSDEAKFLETLADFIEKNK
ncbi:MAG: hypothetical protein A4S09_13655 [Proteobacteria bacterium SG_bin7]|nr:MAG: hypothetical protein A4S09_13655 [Proteobacteria bacterium SG_bin7]